MQTARQGKIYHLISVFCSFFGLVASNAVAKLGTKI